MTHQVDSIFEELERRLLFLEGSSIDNEAMRHELIVRPVLTDPYILGWAGPELITQQTISAVREGSSLPTLNGQTPKWRRPDVLIVPYGLSQPLAVVEEKRRQPSLRTLRSHIAQIQSYQYLHDAVWGLLTDGEKWILLRDDREVHVFRSLREMKRHLRDFQECIGKEAVLRRMRDKGIQEIILTNCTQHVRGVITPYQWTEALDLQAFLTLPSPLKVDVVTHLTMQLAEKGYTLFNLGAGIHSDASCFGDALFMNALIGANASYTLHGGVLTMRDADPEDVAKVKDGYSGAANDWVRAYTLMNDAYARWTEQLQIHFDDLIDLCVEIGASVYRDYFTPECLAYIAQHPQGSGLKMIRGMSHQDFMKKMEEGQVGAKMQLPGGVMVEIGEDTRDT